MVLVGTYNLPSLELLDEVANAVFKAMDGPAVLAIFGDMGVGKTTFIKVLCKKLGCSDAVSSPTYSIVNEYSTQSGDSIFHFDLYRLKDLDEILAIGFEEYLDSGSWCLIEWPEKAVSILPRTHYVLKMRMAKDQRILDLYKASQ